MVRANELACRNGWNADLWVPANVDGDVKRAQPLSGIGDRAASEVEPAEQSDLITSIVAAKTENTSLSEPRPSLAPLAPASGKPAIEEDIIVNQAPSLSWSPPNNTPPAPQPATALVQNPRAAILRARDQYRQRKKSEGRLADKRLAMPAPPYLASSREARLLRESDLAQPEPDPATVDPRYENRPLLQPQPAPLRDDQQPVSPVSLNEITRSFPSMTEFPEDRVRFESIPSVEPDAFEDEVIDIVQDDTWIETRQVDSVLPEPYVVDDFFEEDELVADPEPYYVEEEVELSVQHRESILNRFLRQRRERRKQQPPREEFIYNDVPVEDVPVEPSMSARPATPEPEPVWDEPEWLPPSPETWDPDQSQTSDWSAPAEPLYAEPERTPRYRLQPDPEPPQTSRRYRPTPEPVRPAAIEQDDFVIPPPLPEYRPTEVQTTRPYRERPRPRVEPRREQRPAARQDYIVADEFGDRPLFAADPAPLPEDVQLDTTYGHNDRSTFVSARLDRICQTCRDFRPSENGERGWCNNKWAFSHRRMVDADDLACRNSLGSWWTPKDEAWRRDFDISRHAQQTPRVDQWLLGNRENDVERRRSGS